MCKFIHFRNTIDGRDGTIDTKGGMTVAFEEAEEGHIMFAVAHCSPRDNYCRKTGRAIAQGRLKAGKLNVAKLGNDGVYEVILEALNS